MDPLNDPASYKVLPDGQIRCILQGYVSFGAAVYESAIRAGVIV